MADKILVVGARDYGKPVEDLGVIVSDVEEFIHKPEDFMLVLLTGGADVSPVMYGDTCNEERRRCYSNIERDIMEKSIYRYAKRRKIPIAGICRGLQFINVMEGGKLIHHLDGHEGRYHEFECLKDNRIRTVNSIHHQMVLPTEKGIVIGWSATKLSKQYYGDEDKIVEWEGPEVEASIYPEARACGVQWHPEMMDKNSPGRMFFTNMVYTMLNLPMKDFVSIYTGEAGKEKVMQNDA